MAGPDLDLRTLPEIARDRSAAGRARLFAFLAALLVSRWDRLTGGERNELAALIVVLWSRGAEADRAKLAVDLAGVPDLPETLRSLLPVAAAVAPPPVFTQPPNSAGHSSAAISDGAAMMPGQLPAAATPGKRNISITITQQPAARLPRPSSSNGGAVPIPQPASGSSISVRKPIVRIEQRPLLKVAAPAGIHPPATAERTTPLPPLKTRSPAAMDEVASPACGSSAAAAGMGSPPGLSEAPVAAEPDEPVTPYEPSAPVVQEEQAGVTEAGPLLDAMLVGDMPAPPDLSSAAAVAPLGEDEEPSPPTEPRANPHRLTTALLSEVLASGDFARFEVMLASMTGLRAALLRRVLRDSGGEAFAILARAAGVEREVFSSQWRSWQQRQGDLGRTTIQGDQASAKRIGAFFAALTDQQIDRLIRRWRGDENRVFAASAPS